MKTCIIILNYNNYQDTIECIKSVKQINDTEYEILVVDNCSTNESYEVLKKEACENVKVIQTEKNLGYAGGNNVAIRYARKEGFDYICILNNDTIVDEKFLSTSIEYLENHSDVAFVGPIVLDYHHGFVQSTGGNVLVNRGETRLLNHKVNREDVGLEIECDFIVGACLVFKTALLDDIGLIPENYFLFYEESEWCYKARKKGYRNVCLNTTFILHKGSVSINQYEGLSAYLMARNRVIFFKRNIAAKGFRYLSFLLFLLVDTIYVMIVADKKAWRNIPAYIDGMRNRVSEKYPFIIINEEPVN
ncbi:MAG: glycosyltransferase family 2 protein [Agathobacter sp.]|nr:glycosyltransferase family 2 protein [Agathobacter sp.]